MPARQEDNDILARLSDLERRIRQLESPPASSVHRNPNNITITQADGSTDRVILGLYDEDTDDYGIKIMDDQGRTVFEVNGNGVLLPTINLSWAGSSSDFTSVTTTEFSTNGSGWYYSHLGTLSHDSIRVRLYCSTGVGTTGQVRVSALMTDAPGSPVYTTSAKAVPAASGAYYTFSWTPGGLFVPGYTGLVQIAVDGYRSAGVNNFDVWRPDACYMADASVIGATATGV